MTAAPARDFGPKPELAWLEVGRLFVDHRYQRTLESKRSAALIQKMTAEFYWPAFGALLVAPAADGGVENRYAVVDGQHRFTVAVALGHDRVPCIIIRADSLEAQAAAFLKANKDRIVVNQFAVFHASVKAGLASAVAVNEACARAGVEIPKYQMTAAHIRANQTLAITTIEKLVKEHGVDLVAGALVAIREAYPEERALRSYIIRGVAECLAKDQRVKPEALVQLLGRWGLNDFEQQIWSYQVGGAKWLAVCRCLHETLFPKVERPDPTPGSASPSSVKVTERVRPAVGIAGVTVRAQPGKRHVSVFELPVAKPKAVR